MLTLIFNSVLRHYSYYMLTAELKINLSCYRVCSQCYKFSRIPASFTITVFSSFMVPEYCIFTSYMNATVKLIYTWINGWSNGRNASNVEPETFESIFHCSINIKKIYNDSNAFFGKNAIKIPITIPHVHFGDMIEVSYIST